MQLALNHILVRTSNLKGMIQFFIDALGLKQGERPAFDFAGAWLYSDEKPVIHLSENNIADHGQAEYLGEPTSLSLVGTGIIDHIAFSGNDYPALKERLGQHNISYFERSIPLTGEHQVFVEGPEGLNVEIQFEK